MGRMASRFLRLFYVSLIDYAPSSFRIRNPGMSAFPRESPRGDLYHGDHLLCRHAYLHTLMLIVEAASRADLVV